MLKDLNVWLGCLQLVHIDVFNVVLEDTRCRVAFVAIVLSSVVLGRYVLVPWGRHKMQ